ncbi:thiol:disulfide interchange protein [uncultured Chryseobacterium sp.]|uniref:thiol:disulfide interchange protein n=1 Tax=uncultured Chryseobacterium sp. TaxID=259322 RepID=UPI0025F22FBD|nr:thiol:disulfide interchange protein [uncultured Chryseobacterium sp.]
MKSISLFLMVIPLFCLSQLRTISFADWENKQQQDPKPTVIHLYTDWCSVCKIEQFKLNKDRQLLEFINDKFYFIPFKAEKMMETIRFQRKTFRYLPNGNSGIHELALALSKNKNRPVYPLWIILDKNQNLIDYHEGIFLPDELKKKLSEIPD